MTTNKQGMSISISPLQINERHVILDVLRGVALLGICLANYSEFSLYSFQNESVRAAMPTAGLDTVIRYLQYIFIDGKFYTLFSLLFGIGFSIILSNAERKGRNGMKIFYRRMIVLFFIGLAHLIFLWAGDILILYAFVGFFLPLFRNLSNRILLISAVSLLLLPIAIDACIVLFGWNLSAPVIAATQHFHKQFGITEKYFPIWLLESQSYLDVLKFNIAGSFIRLQEFIEGNRAFKVLGIFLLGLYVGRNKLYTNLGTRKPLLKKVTIYGFLIGLPLSILYAWSAMHSQPLGLVGHSTIYAFSVVPLALAYASAICLWYLRDEKRAIFEFLGAPGRMALTNYIMQSVFGILIFYGFGFGIALMFGLFNIGLIAIGVFVVQATYSYVWLFYYRFGPLEWIWRMLTYGKTMYISRF